ncbi:MAG: ribosome silencing factor [Bacteroidaceae bacterium]|nr:ribosome silencing factor [Bacteroidaceae bacterium]
MYHKGTHKLVDSIVDGLQDKKGRNIVVVDLSGIEDTICTYFVIAHGGSPSQVHALAMSVGDKARELCSARPLAVDGLRNSVWVAMDYAEVIVHIFLPEERAFYNIEHLWADAELTEIPDLD